MEKLNTNTNSTTSEAFTVDMVTEDFKTSLFIVSLLVNLTVFVSWLAIVLN